VSRRIGLLGGTFDPPHVGHLWLGETAFDQMGLDEVWFLPVGQPPHKEGQVVTAVSHRLTMTQLAIQPFPYFTLSRADIDRPLPHSTVSLLHCLSQTHADTQFSLIIGSDSLRDFATWDYPNQLIQQCRLVVLNRPGVVVEWERLETAVPNIRAAIDWLHGPTVDISSTAIRQWARAGRSLKVMLVTAVLDYIQQHHLYNNVVSK